MKRYENMDQVSTKSNLSDLYKWWKESSNRQKDLSWQVPAVKNPSIDFLRKNREMPTLTWIGHSTFLLQMAGLNIITDPIWTKWLSGYRRLSPAGIPIKQLPPIDIVLISHSHYDHLSYHSIKRLPGSPTFFVPSGLGKWFVRKGFDQVAEFEWWGTQQYRNVTFTFVPAQHWTKRTLFDTNTSHWGGWVLKGENIPTVYFAGDSGYFRGFTEIGKRFAIDYALIPIGAYEPEWFMSKEHVTPEEAIQAFLDCGAKKMFPMHYGAYMLADDSPKEAVDRLQDEWELRGLDKQRLLMPQLGEMCYL
ncbi:MBL fold metallo-hydrolase [Virgibacillus sp. 179-BFC.A HS]|uniref:MBL fold metallo-hydrolase n=1 Tax=Tigheibacillus jepli TaxID=3035914 RepID=A0ABU5CKX1_9BACI|nr:MBL fold metallo-hydrolase [Virgibacillus sp. 179-BFC.A HS]MDY0406974.1 MBL fold metallo-hydrolase [Virgibacillus sp. 179-BFC.A HS]